MNYRLNKTALYAVSLLVLIAVGIFGYTLVRAPSEESTTEEKPVVNEARPSEKNVVLTAQHQYKDGLHIVAGVAQLPTPCHRLLTEPFFVGEDKSSVEIQFTTSIEGDVCAQVVTDARFKVTFEAPEDIAISATWDGGPATLNLVPVPEGEDLENFELFMKG